MKIESFYHSASGTFTHVVVDAATRKAAVIDPVLGFDVVSGTVDEAPVRMVLNWLGQRNLIPVWILETHAHADHLSGAAVLRRETGALVGIGAGIRAVQQRFAREYGLGDEFPTDGSQFDHLFEDGERFPLGELEVEVIATPGHTSDSVSYRIGDAVFVGDSLFMPDSGTARCDFPGGDAGLLFDSIKRLYALADSTRMFVCHDYGPDGRAALRETTVGEQKQANIHIRADTAKQEFVDRREVRDAGLDLPRLIIPAIQVNIRAGELPEADAGGRRFLKWPVDGFLGIRR